MAERYSLDRAPAPPPDAGTMPSALPVDDLTRSIGNFAPPPVPGAVDTTKRYSLSDNPETLRQSMRIGSEINPAVAARVLDVEKKSGLPRKYVEENLDEMERAVALKSFDPMHFRANSPKFAAWLAGDPHALAVAKKDIALMGPFEKGLALWEAGRAAADPRLTDLYGKELEGKRLTPQETVEMAVLKKRQQTASQAMDRASAIPWAISAGAYSIRQAEDSVLNTLKGAGAGAALGLMATGGTGGPVALGAGAVAGALTAGAIYSYNLESASAFGEFKDEKDVNGAPLADVQLARGAARAYGVMASVVETGSDAALGGLAAKLMPGLNALKQKLGAEGAKVALKQATKEMLANPTKRAVFAKMAGGVVGAAGLQALEEVAQTFLQALAGDVMKGKSEQTFAPTDWGKVSGDAADAAKQAFVGSLFIGGPIGAVGAKLRLNEVAQAQENQKVFQALGETMAQSDMVKNAPDVVEAAVSAITADTKAQNVYVPVATWNALFQADARGAAQEILGDTTQYDEAVSLTGADIVIPIGKYAAKVAGTPLHEKLTPDLRLEQGGLSAREATEAMANAEKLLALHVDDAKVAAEQNAPLEAIQKEAYDMVRPFMGEREAARYALVESQRYATRAARMGVDPAELWKTEAPIVQRDFAARASETALASDTNFATMMKGSRLTVTGEVWSKPGDELALYHGSGANITTFRPRQSGAVFLSTSPSVASEYAGRGAPDGGAVYKVHASAAKPFDYDNAAHVDDIAQAMGDVSDRDVRAMSASQTLRGLYKNKAELIAGIRAGAWGAIEHPMVQRAIKAQRYDAFWVMEEGIKNLGIYDPKMVKSATGNRGTYDTTKDNILYQALPAAWPSSVGANPSIDDILLPSIETARKNPKLLAKLVNAVRGETGMRTDAATTEEALEAVVSRMVDNLLWLHDQIPAKIRARSKLWYDGGQNIAQRWAERWGKTRAQAAGMLAVLSPQKDWFMNTTMAERVGDILDTQMGHQWDDRMTAASFKFLAQNLAIDSSHGNIVALNLVRGKTLAEAVATKNDTAIGIWIRAYDEAYNASAHALITPEGAFEGNVLTDLGNEARRAWGDFGAIGKAASVFVDGSPENINAKLGRNHKVRNFYNNLFNAPDPRFVTIDTHAVAAAHVRPFAGADQAVKNNFESAGTSDVLGLNGSYPIYYEAYQRAAAARGLLPREMQSITWEAVRSLFPDTFKTKANKDKVEAVWAQVDAGTLTVKQAHAQVKKLALGPGGKIPPPAWWPGRIDSDQLRDKTYENEREAFVGTKVIFEVAPDPRDEALKDRWDKLSMDERQRISTDIAWNVVARALDAFRTAKGTPVVGMKGELHSQLGGWRDDTNPSFGLWMDPNAPKGRLIELAKLLGYALNQEGMMVTARSKFEGSFESGAIVIEGVDALVAKDLYDELRASVRAEDGSALIEGHTTGGGLMAILVPEDGGMALAARVAEYLGERYNVSLDTLHVAWPEKGDNDYGLSRTKIDSGFGSRSSVRAFGDHLREQAAAQLEAALRDGSQDSPGQGRVSDPDALRQEDPVDGPARDGSGRYSSGSLAPLPGAPAVKGAAGPDPQLVAVAERYARDNGVPLARQSEYVQVDPARAARIASAYADMPHAPNDPAVRAAYADLIRQTRAQYNALVAAGYSFTFFDSASDPYQGNPWNAMRDLRANKRMAVYGTYDGFGPEGLPREAVDNNPLLVDTGLEWPDQDGVPRTVTANDLFRAVHDAFGHGLEGAGFRAQGEENAWQAHSRLFTGPALGAITSETRGQNSWLNYGPYGEQNRTAKVESTIFAEQKTGLMPAWTWEEGRAGDMDTGPLGQRGPTVRGQFERAPAGQRPIITLFKSANPSTIWHELSHSWLEELRRDAEGPHSTPQLKADWETVRKAAGIPELKPGEQIPRNSHEWFARGSEAYVREGVAPSLELRSVFSQFATWLKRIYKSIKDLIGEDELAPEFKAVMDRLLATDEQITAAREAAAFEATALPIDELTKAEATEYQKLVTEVKLEAEERVRAEAMNEIVRERTDWWRAEKAQVTREVESEVNTRPEYQARSWLRTGRLLDGSEIEGLQHARIDRQALVYQYGEGMLQKLAFLYQAEGGLHPDIVAEAFGYDSGDAMLKAIVESPPRKEVIAAEVDKIMMERHGDMLNDGGLAERAIEAVHSDKQADVLLTELRILKRLGAVGELTTWQAIRNLATTIVGRKAVGDLRAKHYVAAGARAGYEAERAMIGKDYTHAFDAKLQQLMNLALVQEVTARKAAVDKAMRTWKVMDRSDERLSKSRDINLVNTARAVLANYGIGKKGEKAVTYLELVQEYDPATYDDLIELVSLASAEEKPYTILTVEEFTQMQEIVDGLWQLSRNAQQSLVDGQKINRDQIKAELSAAIDALGNKPNQRGVKQALSKMDEFTVTLLDWRASLRRVEHWVELMDGGKPGVFRKYVWQPVSEAADRYREARKTVMQRYLDLSAEYLTDRITADKIDASEIGYTFSGRAELLGALLHTGNESNLAKLLVGGRGKDAPWGSINQDGTLDTSKWDAFIRRAQRDGILVKADYDFVQSVWDLMEDLKPGAQAAHREMYGYYFNEITSKAFDTPWGQYTGGYAPAATDSALVADAAGRADEAALRPQMTFMFPTTGKGFTKSRVENYRQPLQLNLGLVQQHIDKVLRFTHIEPRVREVSRLALDKTFRAKVASFVDTEVVTEMLVPWLERAAQQQVETPAVSRGMRKLDGFFRALRTRTGAQIMVGNLSNALQQVTGLSSALLEVKPKYLRDSLVSYIGSPSETAEWAAAKSSFMRNRTTASVIEVQQEIDNIMLDPSKYDEVRAFATRHGYFLQQGAQNVVDLITWRGAYNQAVAEKMRERDAVRHADAAVRKTQGSFAAEDLSRFETGGASFRLFTMFYSYFNLQANLLGNQFAQAVQDSGFKAPGRLFYIYVFGLMIPAALAEGIAQAMSGELWDDDDDDGYLDNFLSVFFTGQFKFATAMVPFVGQGVNAMVNRFNDKPYDDKISVSPAISIIDAMVGTPVSLYNVAFNDGSWKKAIKDTLTLVGIATGLPLGVLARPLGYAADVEQGKVEPANAADYIRGLISGRGTQQ